MTNSSPFSRHDSARPSYKTRPNALNTLCGKIFLMRCTIQAYADPVPAGELGATERDAAAVKIALAWGDRKSNAWHEANTFYGTLDRCPCCPCRKSRGEKI